jgi:integrase
MSQPARVLEAADVRRLLKHVRKGRYGSRNQVAVLLSFKAGLRACEIAGLEWGMVLRPNGLIDRHITVAGKIAKNSRGRRVPINPDLEAALGKLHLQQGRPRRGAVILSERGSNMRARSVVNWFREMYAQLDMTGCSSHSGRRTFITGAARLLAKTGGSLRDVQELAGHRSLSTTEGYIAGDRDIQRKLVQLI